ncbi:ABC transporter substrate-binding protein [Paenibacillus sp. FSL H8-0259]|uniref:ABC transporter substrate-binding protein n=1 Tax=Paenibacillus sp. FSL H8-0259 TaxID=1920423 RepID=UPI00096E8DBA|nr:extracellular solute-binding protein [Paenibacillus sp. FSL H8-0259]OMF25904.1 ABC transporter substrate-binding protein [Paenibacillus sp. FSL H8-0259]
MRKILGLTLAAMLLAATTACSGGNNGKPAAGSSDTAEPSVDQVELRIMWWGDQKRADKTNEALRKFEEKYPNIKVVGEFAPNSGYFDKLNTQLASGTAPDVFFLGGNVTDYADKGVLLDLQPYVGKELDLTDMDQTMVEYGTLGGKLVHISAGANARGMVINTELFKQAGMDIPADGWSWEDYARISKEISGKLGKGYYGTYNFTVEGMDIYMKQRGKQVYDMEKDALGFEQQDAEDWFNYWNDMSKNGGMVTPSLQVSNPPGDTSKSLVVTGKVAMSLIPSNQFAAHQNLIQDTLTMVQVPRGPKGTGVVFESSQGLSGYAKTEHPKEVATLMNYWINDPDAAQILGSDRGVPVTSKMRDLLMKDATPLEQTVYDFTSRVSEATKKEPFAISYNPPSFTEFTKLAETAVQEIGFEQKDVKQGVEDFYKGATQIFGSK